MPRPWRGGKARGRGGGRGRGGSFSYRGGSTSSSSASSQGLVSGNFRRLNMKGKRYLRAPNTSAASVRRRRWAHKNERRMLDRSEHGYGGMEELPDESAAAAAAVAGANESTGVPIADGDVESSAVDLQATEPQENINPAPVPKVEKKKRGTACMKPAKPCLAMLNESLGGKPSALTALAGFSSPGLPDQEASGCSQQSSFSFGSQKSSFSLGSQTSSFSLGSQKSSFSLLGNVLPAEKQTQCYQPGNSSRSMSALDSLLSTSAGIKSIGEVSTCQVTNGPYSDEERQQSPPALPSPPAPRQQKRSAYQSKDSSDDENGGVPPTVRKERATRQSRVHSSDDDCEKISPPASPSPPPLPRERPARKSKGRDRQKSRVIYSDDEDEEDDVPSPLPSQQKRRPTRQSKGPANRKSKVICSDEEEDDSSPPPSPPRKKRAARPKKSASMQGVPTVPPSAPASEPVPQLFEFPGDDMPGTSGQKLGTESSGPILTANNQEDVDDFVGLALHEMGYSEFRPGQYEAVMRILAGRSTLVVSATGSGKSLCYQLPALMYWRERQSITLVVSPLVSLMMDQVANLPSVIPGACLHTNMTMEKKSQVWDDVRNRKLAVLYVSPESLVGRGSLFLLNMLPPIAFACIDESHCLSQWSHNFRPSYLQVCKVLRDRFNTSCVLGLTATATAKTAEIVARHIGVCDLDEGIVGKFKLPPNLRLSVSCVDSRDQALLDLLKSEPLEACKSIIVYCTRRQTTENIAEMLRSMLGPRDFPTIGKKRRRKADSMYVEAYHAGMEASHRTRVQRNFMSGELRIVVATVAFGMGLDKSDIRAIVHFDMPSSLESYVQEIGRAGRDGNVSFCHVFLDQKGSDFNELRRHVFSNAVERYTVKQLLQRVFPRKCNCAGLNQQQTHTVHVPQEHSTVIQDDRVKASEAASQDTKQDETNTDASACDTLSSIRSENTEAADSGQLPDAARCKDGQGDGQEMTDGGVVEASEAGLHSSENALQCGAGDITSEKCDSPPDHSPVRNQPEPVVEPEPDSDCQLDHSTAHRQPEVRCFGHNIELKVEPLTHQLDATEETVATLLAYLHLYDDGSGANGNKQRWWLQLLPNKSVDDTKFFCFRTPGDLSDEDRDNATAMLLAAAGDHQAAHLYRLCALQDALSRSVLPHHFVCKRGVDHDDAKVKAPLSKKEILLREAIAEYFDDNLVSDSCAGEVDVPSDNIAGVVHQDVRRLLRTHLDVSWTARAIARLFQGIGSPQFPSDVWFRNRTVWRRHADLDYRFVYRVAREELISYR